MDRAHPLLLRPSKSNADKQDKHALRKAFHPQLSLLWRQNPLKTVWDFSDLQPRRGKVSPVQQVGGVNFVAVVSERLHLFAESLPGQTP